jgi:hypothetical protein
VEQYKIDHRNEKDAITETVEDGATKEMKAVAAKDIGLSSDEYRQTAELVGLLAPAFALKECFEHKALTGASSLIPHLTLSSQNHVRHEDASLCEALPQNCEPRRPKP